MEGRGATKRDDIITFEIMVRRVDRKWWGEYRYKLQSGSSKKNCSSGLKMPRFCSGSSRDNQTPRLNTKALISSIARTDSGAVGFCVAKVCAAGRKTSRQSQARLADATPRRISRPCPGHVVVLGALKDQKRRQLAVFAALQDELRIAFGHRRFASEIILVRALDQPFVVLLQAMR